ncbi:hypothetical protein WAT24_14020 [Fulvimonas yonginensis]|uniref:Uncharacterized protein n=2 Tax=Fulvimonas yonginensis TaxID=1495200 RepID=A0ABU8JE80_9GAMM
MPRRAIWAGLVVMGISTAAVAAQPPGTGLGQAWPNAQDVSSSPHWHVYVFTQGGIRYVQVNDLNGHVRGAFATANGQFLVLPMGRDAQRMATPQQSPRLSRTVVPLASYGETIYRDSSIQLSAVPLSDGTMMFTATQTATTTQSATGDCGTNPMECGAHSN